MLNADYVEIFNPTGSTLTPTNYSIQYASASGTTIATVTVLPATITLAPGQYYLIAATPGSNGAALPMTPDAANTNIAFGASTGKVALVSSTTKLSAACNTSDPTVVDFVAYGAGTNCALGSAAPAPSTTLADVRTNVCTITNNNGTEFALLAPAPQTRHHCRSSVGLPRRCPRPVRRLQRRSTSAARRC